MMPLSPECATIIGAAINGVIAGGAVVFVWWRGRQEATAASTRQIKAQWSALDAESAIVDSLARTYIRETKRTKVDGTPDPIYAPAYRLPMSAIETAFPQLLQADSLTKENAHTFVEYWRRVREINGCIDAAQRAHEARRQVMLKGDTQLLWVWLQDEGERVAEKCREIIGAQPKGAAPEVTAGPLAALRVLIGRKRGLHEAS